MRKTKPAYLDTEDIELIMDALQFLYESSIINPTAHPLYGKMSQQRMDQIKVKLHWKLAAPPQPEKGV